MLQGYAHAGYARSLAEFGRPRELASSGGWLLERAIPNADRTDARDAMGCYPLFACQDWRALGDDLRSLERELVSVVLVADPLGDHDPALLDRTFNRGAIPFKEHQIVDLKDPLEKTVSSHHRRNVRKALKTVTVERVAKPTTALDEWVRLYDVLVRRHSISGMRAFSRASFAQQLATPGMEVYRGIHDGETVGMLLFYVQGGAAYYHLGAYSERGYELGAAFALFWISLEQLSETVARVSLGGDAGVTGEDGGLARFKRGWSNATKQAFLCRHVCDPNRYSDLARGAPDVPFFPIYRSGEFLPAAAPPPHLDTQSHQE